MGRGSWQVQAVLDRQDAAVEQAHDMHRLEQDNMFKVVRVDFNNGTGEFREREILKVGKQKAGNGRYGEGLDAGPACVKLPELLSPEARRATRRVLRSWLDSVGITPLELMHHPDYLTRLENSGTMLQSAVQRAAMAQSKATGQDLHERQRILFRLVDELLAKARRLWRDEERPRFDGTNLSALVERIKDDLDSTYLFNAAISDWLTEFKTSAEKLAKLVDVAEQTTTSAGLERLDGCLADFLEDANAVVAMLGEQESLGDALQHVAALVGAGAGADDLEISGDERFAVFKNLVRENKLPQCRRTFIRRVVSSLEGQRPLTDKGIAAEAALTARLQRSLLMPDGGYLGGVEVEAALERRAERFVSPDAIGRLLDGIVAPDKRVRALLNAEVGVIGDRNKRRFGEYIVAILRVPDNVTALSEPNGPPAVYMRDLATLQTDLNNSGATEKQKQDGAEVLDRVCTHILKSERILEKIAERSDGAVGEALAIMRLCAAGTFTEGEAAQAARERIVRCLKSPSFLEKYLVGANDAGEKRRRLEELQELFSSAKVPRTPLSVAVSMALG